MISLLLARKPPIVGRLPTGEWLEDAGEPLIPHLVGSGQGMMTRRGHRGRFALHCSGYSDE